MRTASENPYSTGRRKGFFFPAANGFLGNIANPEFIVDDAIVKFRGIGKRCGSGFPEAKTSVGAFLNEFIPVIHDAFPEFFGKREHHDARGTPVKAVHGKDGSLAPAPVPVDEQFLRTFSARSGEWG